VGLAEQRGKKSGEKGAMAPDNQRYQHQKGWLKEYFRRNLTGRRVPLEEGRRAMGGRSTLLRC